MEKKTQMKKNINVCYVSFHIVNAAHQLHSNVMLLEHNIQTFNDVKRKNVIIVFEAAKGKGRN